MKIFNSPILKVLYLLSLCLIATPIFAMFRLAFSNSQYLKPQGFTTFWITKVLTDKTWLLSIKQTTIIAILSSVIAIILALPVSQTLRTCSAKTRKVIYLFFFIPAITPVVILACALLKWYYIFNLVDTYVGAICSNCLLSLPIVLLIINNSSNNFFFWNPNIEFASKLMGVSRLMFFFKVILPNLTTGLLISFLLSFTISFNEAVVVQFISGIRLNLISKKLYEGLKFEINPEIAAASFLLIFLVLLCYLILRIFLKKYL